MPNSPIPAAGEAMPVETPRIEDLFNELLGVRAELNLALDDEDARLRNLAQFEELQERITSMTPATARDMAIMLYVETTGGVCDYREEFMSRVFGLIGMKNDNVPEGV